MVFTFRSEGFDDRGAGLASTAVLSEIANKRVHILEIGGVIDEAPFLPALR
jgi:hypothetical protein